MHIDFSKDIPNSIQNKLATADLTGNIGEYLDLIIQLFNNWL